MAIFNRLPFLRIFKREGGPRMAEFGGAEDLNRGYSQIICNPDFSKPFAAYIPEKGELSCRIHAYIQVTYYMYVVMCRRNNRLFKYWIYRLDPLKYGIETIIEPQLVMFFKQSVTLSESFEMLSAPIFPPRPFLSESDVPKEYFRSLRHDVTSANHLGMIMEVARIKSTFYHCRKPLYAVSPGIFRYGEEEAFEIHPRTPKEDKPYSLFIPKYGELEKLRQEAKESLYSVNK